MREIAGRAGASKETLYAWFGDKRGLFEELIGWQAERVDEALGSSLEEGTGDPAVVLRAFAMELIGLLLGERSVVINRAAISEAPVDQTFARILAEKGRGSIVPKLERYLEAQRARGRLDFGEAGAAAEALIGLSIGDLQVRRLLGVVPVLEPEQIEARAERAVQGFLTMFAPDGAESA
jgi:AcrR family transcriptional regulator